MSESDSAAARAARCRRHVAALYRAARDATARARAYDQCARDATARARAARAALARPARSERRSWPTPTEWARRSRAHTRYLAACEVRTRAHARYLAACGVRPYRAPGAATARADTYRSYVAAVADVAAAGDALARALGAAR